MVEESFQVKNQTNLPSQKVPGSKGLRDENFPVGSVLIQKSLRRRVHTFYAFARASDDIADDPEINNSDKLALLNGYESTLKMATEDDPSFLKAYCLAMHCRDSGVTVQHGIDLIQAFKQDVTKQRYSDWADLIKYCEFSAAPVGRFLLDLHDENKSLYAYSDALCNVLQVLNHLQDIKSDYQKLNRVYLPSEWLSEFQVNLEDLGAGRSTPALRSVIDQCLENCEKLMGTARKLPAKLKSRRLTMEAETILRLADRLAARLKTHDPIEGRVKLTKIDFVMCSLMGFGAGLIR